MTPADDATEAEEQLPPGHSYAAGSTSGQGRAAATVSFDKGRDPDDTRTMLEAWLRVFIDGRGRRPAAL